MALEHLDIYWKNNCLFDGFFDSLLLKKQTKKAVNVDLLLFLL
jgi:hypothetical protein